jgi:prepilin peptidase CpaA
MGGGDAKLLTACALWFGLGPGLISFLVNTAVMGGVVTLVILLIRWQAPALLAMGAKLPHSLVSARKIPYGIAIALGGALSLQHAPILVAVG